MSDPHAWSEAPLGQVCRIVSGATPKTGQTAYWGGDVPWVTPNDMSKDRSQVLFSGDRSLSTAGYASCSATTFPRGSVMVSSRAPIGYVAIAGTEMCTNQGCKTATPPDYIDSKYLYWYLIAAKRDLEARASGTTFKEVSARVFGETVFRWPALDEQRRIVEILEDHLSRLDAASDLLARSKLRLSALRRSALWRFFGAHDGDLAPLSRLVRGIEAGKSLGSSSGPAREGEWGIIKVSAMTWGEFDPTENKAISAEAANASYEIRPGDLLLSRANTSEHVGASVLVRDAPRHLLLSDKSLRLLPHSSVQPEWLWRVLQSPDVRSQISAKATGTKDSMRNISQGALLNVLVPTLDERDQRADLAAFEAIDAERERMASATSGTLVRAHSLRRALLSAAFSGRLTGRSTDAEVIEEQAELMDTLW
ncbi:MAG: restriction endonuclease subunit S [Dermatophilaceae bacterium]